MVRTGSDIRALRLLEADRRLPPTTITSPSASVVLSPPGAVHQRAVHRAEVDDAEPVVGGPDLGVVARHLRVGEGDRAVGQPADDRDRPRRAGPGARRAARARRRAASAFDDLGVDARSPRFAALVGHDVHLDRPDEVVALVAGVLADRLGELARRARRRSPRSARVSAGARPTAKWLGATVPAHAERAAGVELAHEPATDLDGLEAAAEGLARRCPRPAARACARTAGVPSSDDIPAAVHSLSTARMTSATSRTVLVPCPARASGGIGRRAGFRFLCPQGRGGSSPPSPTLAMSRDIVDRSLRTCRTLASGLVDPVGVDAVFGDVLSVGGEDADVAVVDEHAGLGVLGGLVRC